jgi:AcrR family transcriptional regulator
MGTAARREREKEERRRSILDAAERVFFSKGIKDASMDEIAEAAEVSKGTLYLYFSSKEEIYLGINHRALKILKAMFEAVMAMGGVGIEKIRDIGRAYYEFSQKFPDYFEAMMHFDAEVTKLEEAGPVGLECHKEGVAVLGLVAEAIRTGIADGSIRSDLDPMKTAILLWAQTDGVIRVVARKCEHIKEFENIDLHSLIEDSFTFIYGSLRPPGGGTAGGGYQGEAGGDR